MRMLGRTIASMTDKPPPKVTILFLAILPIGAWLAVLYFCLVLIGATSAVLEIFGRLSQL